MKVFKKIKALFYLPLRFPCLFLSLLFSFLWADDPISTFGVFLWPYSFCLFWNENEFYRVTSKRKYKYSFVNFLMKIKKYVKRKNVAQEKIFQFIIPVLPLALLASFMQERNLLLPLLVGYPAFQVDSLVQKKWLW